MTEVHQKVVEAAFRLDDPAAGSIPATETNREKMPPLIGKPLAWYPGVIMQTDVLSSAVRITGEMS